MTFQNFSNLIWNYLLFQFTPLWPRPTQCFTPQILPTANTLVISTESVTTGKYPLQNINKREFIIFSTEGGPISLAQYRQKTNTILRFLAEFLPVPIYRQKSQYRRICVSVRDFYYKVLWVMYDHILKDWISQIYFFEILCNCIW